MASAPPLKVAVIGAGVAGLATARALKTEGHQIVVYERSDRLGGTWVYDSRVESDPLSQDPNRERVNSSLYPSLRTNLPRQLMGFSDYPFRVRKGDNSGRIFPGHEDVLQFLIEFAEDFGLVELIRFNSEVIRVERVGSRNDEWVVESKESGSNLEEVFDAVVVCNGHYNKPRVARLPGIEKWSGEQLHSHNYRGPDPFRNKVVVVIGVSASGFDISAEISVVAKEIHVSARPSPVNKIMNLESRDNIWRHSEITCVQENGEVSFQDGSSVFADIIFHCTGFEFDTPFLKTDGVVTVDDNRVGPLYKHVFPPKLAPWLSFVGLPYMVCSMDEYLICAACLNFGHKSSACKLPTHHGNNDQFEWGMEPNYGNCEWEGTSYDPRSNYSWMSYEDQQRKPTLEDVMTSLHEIVDKFIQASYTNTIETSMERMETQVEQVPRLPMEEQQVIDVNIFDKLGDEEEQERLKGARHARQFLVDQSILDRFILYFLA